MADRIRSRCHIPARYCRSVESEAANLLQNHSHFRGRTLDITFELNDDVLIIRGRVPSIYLKQLLQSLLRDIKNVSRIQNNVDVVSSSGVCSISRHTNQTSGNPTSSQLS
jgi:hypothetical protein